METFRFLKEFVGLGNGDLILLLAFKKDWRLTIRDCMDNLGLQHAHAYRILETFNAKGICKKVIIKKRGNRDMGTGRKINVYIFNNGGAKIVEKIFEKKILPKIPLTPKDFKKAKEIDLIIENI